jgi:hypothetical protein
MELLYTGSMNYCRVTQETRDIILLKCKKLCGVGIRAARQRNKASNIQSLHYSQRERYGGEEDS